MTTVTAASARAGLVTPSLGSRRVRAAVGAAGLTVAAGGGLLIATSAHLVDPVKYGLEAAVLVAGTTFAALYWATHRPGNRLAAFLLAYGGSLALVSLQGASGHVLHAIGVLADGSSFFLGFLVIFAFPSGRVAGLADRLVLAFVAWVVLASFLPFVFFSPYVAGAAPLAHCNALCPRNGLMVADRPDLAGGFGTTEEYLDAALAISIFALLLYRLVAASEPRRRASLPVYLPALALTLPFGVFHAEGAGLMRLSAHGTRTLGWFVTGGRVALTVGFFLAIWQAMLFAGVAMKTIMSRLGLHDEPAHLRRLVAEALDDPPLELSFQVGGEASVFVDSQGRPVDPRRAVAGRASTPLERRGEVVAYVTHDPALETDPELLQAAGQAVLLALETGRLEAELSEKTVALRNSSARIVAAGEAERRMIERDLHDGAQQRLMSIQIKLALLRDRVDDPKAAAAIDELSADASAAVEDLRRIAHGIYPAVLRERGLGDGVRAWVRSAPVAIVVTDTGLERLAPAVEASVYFCVLEAIQNAIKHSGPASHIDVAFARRDGRLQFSVSDDGAGFETAAVKHGMGLTSMHERMEALGGDVEIVSSPGAGTTVRGAVPV
jgi:signal transduction histidine kinase